MTRTPRHPEAFKPGDTTPAMALHLERNGTWPSYTERHRFWNTIEIPPHLTNWCRPDPRKVLTGEEGRLEYEVEFRQWEAKRLAWLEAQVDG